MSHSANARRFRPVRFGLAVLLGASLLPAATGATLASTPPSSSATAPAGGGSVTREYTGTVPPGGGGTAECIEGVNADLHTFTINPFPANFYDTRTGTARFRIRWSPTTGDIATQDLLLRVFDPDGTALESDGGSPSEVVIFTNPKAGEYQVYACGFLLVAPQDYLGDITLEIAPKTGQVPNPPSTATSLRFGPITTVDPQRDIAEPSLRVDRDGNEYICGPFGASRAAEYAQKSEDDGDTFRVLGLPPEGRIAPGGGGDCEISVGRQRNAEGNFTLSYTGLAALVNFSTGRSTNAGRSFVGNAVSESPVVVDRQWMDSVGANEVYLTYRQIPLGSFVQHSTDGGLTYGPGTLAIEEIDRSGNLIVDNRVGRENDVYIAYAYNGSVKVARSTNADSVSPTYQLITVKAPCAENPPPATDRNCTRGRPDNIFPSIAQDSAGNLYLAWTEAGTYNTYYAYSTNSGTTWSPKVQVNRDDIFSTVLPWIDAGDDGRIAISFYGSVIDGNPQLGSFRGPWDVYVNTVTNAHSLPANPDDKAVSQTKVTTHPIHWNSICLSGLGCSLTNPPGDRTLLDLFQVKHDPEGRIRVTYNESNKRYTDDFGPIAIEVYSKQTAGPDLIGAAEPPDPRPVVDFRRADPAGDARFPFSFFPSPTAPPSPPFRTNYPALDFRSVSAAPGTVGGNPAVTFTMKLADLSDAAILAAQVGLESTNLLYVARFFSGFEAHAAVASVDAAGDFTFGYTNLALSADGKLETYPPTTPVPGSVNQATGEITVRVPYSLIQHVTVNGTNPAAAPSVRASRDNDLIHEVTGFTFGNPTGDPFTQAFLNQADSTPPFDYRLGSDPSDPAALSIDDVRRLEGDSGTRDFVFTVTRTGNTTGTSSVRFHTEEDTAKVPQDFLATNGTLTFGPGVTSRTITVQVVGDGKRAPDEIFFVQLTNPVGTTLLDGRGKGTIRNDDPYLVISDLTVDEPASGTITARFKVTLSYPTPVTVRVHYRTRDGTATAPSDYTAVQDTTLTFSPGQTVKYANVTVRANGSTEPDETFRVELFGEDNAILKDGVGIGLWIPTGKYGRTLARTPASRTLSVPAIGAGQANSRLARPRAALECRSITAIGADGHCAPAAAPGAGPATPLRVSRQ